MLPGSALALRGQQRSALASSKGALPQREVVRAVRARGAQLRAHACDEAIARAGEVMTDWRGSHILKGSGHWLQQEKAEETNALVIEFLKGL